jgi:hypothetical protein
VSDWIAQPVPEIDPKNVHVFPQFGREHVCVGLTCWCQPERTYGEPRVILHHVEQ